MIWVWATVGAVAAEFVLFALISMLRLRRTIAMLRMSGECSDQLVSTLAAERDQMVRQVSAANLRAAAADKAAAALATAATLPLHDWLTEHDPMTDGDRRQWRLAERTNRELCERLAAAEGRPTQGNLPPTRVRWPQTPLTGVWAAVKAGDPTGVWAKVEAGDA